MLKRLNLEDIHAMILKLQVQNKKQEIVLNTIEATLKDLINEQNTIKPSKS